MNYNIPGICLRKHLFSGQQQNNNSNFVHDSIFYRW